jgi:hypothetical protein
MERYCFKFLSTLVFVLIRLANDLLLHAILDLVTPNQLPNVERRIFYSNHSSPCSFI